MLVGHRPPTPGSSGAGRGGETPQTPNHWSWGPPPTLASTCCHPSGSPRQRPSSGSPALRLPPLPLKLSGTLPTSCLDWGPGPPRPTPGLWPQHQAAERPFFLCPRVPKTRPMIAPVSSSDLGRVCRGLLFVLHDPRTMCPCALGQRPSRFAPWTALLTLRLLPGRPTCSPLLEQVPSRPSTCGAGNPTANSSSEPRFRGALRLRWSL